MKRINIYFLVFFLFIPFLVTAGEIANKDQIGVKTVVIDAGHGGKDPGAIGSAFKEKDIALAVSLKLGKYIEENFKDVKVIYTRKEDVFLELHERAKIANDVEADLFICVHVNNASYQAKGAETYVMGLHVSEQNLEVAKRENASILLEQNYEATYGNFDPNSAESYIIFNMMQSAFLEQSSSFADKVQNQFRNRVGRVDRGVKQAGFLVLRETTMPSVLIETGFISNSDEERFLGSDQGQDYLASAIFRAFRDYKNEIEGRTNTYMVNDKDSVAGVFFKVQLKVSSEKIELKPENFNGLKGVEVYEAGGLYRYTFANEREFKVISEIQAEVRKKGYEDAFVIAFKDGKRIPVEEAVNMIKN